MELVGGEPSLYCKLTDQNLGVLSMPSSFFMCFFLLNAYDENKIILSAQNINEIRDKNHTLQSNKIKDVLTG